MTVIIRASGNIGPFKTVETLSDRLRCDGVDYSFTVLGSYSTSNDDSLAPVPITSPVAVPPEVPKWAAEIALIDAGLDALPQQYLDSLPAGAEKKKAVALHRSRPMWRRNSAMLQAAITAGLVTSTQVDDFFIAADAIAKTA